MELNKNKKEIKGLNKVFNKKKKKNLKMNFYVSVLEGDERMDHL